MKTITTFVPPVGTLTVPRPMTLAERKHAGRIEFAKYVATTLQMQGLDTISANDHGCQVHLYFSPDGLNVTIVLQRRRFDRSLGEMPIHDPGDGRNSLQSWLFHNEPTLGLRLLKNARKQINDAKASEGQRLAQASCKLIEPHSPYPDDFSTFV